MSTDPFSKANTNFLQDLSVVTHSLSSAESLSAVKYPKLSPVDQCNDCLKLLCAEETELQALKARKGLRGSSGPVCLNEEGGN